MGTLFDRFPSLKASLPHLQLTALPTPVTRADRLAAELGVGSLLIKRDDLSALAYGGNKVRKLDFLLADAIEQQCDSVLTFGAVGSNHALATSIFARRQGLVCHAILTEQPQTPYVADTLRHHVLLGTRLHHATDYGQTLALSDKVVASHPAGEAGIYRIKWGGSSWLGAVGFVAAAFELVDQLPRTEWPDDIYCACGTMGTVVGLAIGLRLAGAKTTIHAVQVTPPAVFSVAGLERLFEEVVTQLHARAASIPLLRDPLSNIAVRDRYFGEGYALPTPGALAGVAAAARTEQLKLETTYTGKAMAALMDDARDGALLEKRVMFWNTYNGRPPPPGLADVNTDALPDSLRRYLIGG